MGRFRSFVRGALDIWGIVSMLGIASILSAVWAWANELGPWSLFIATGVFAFGVIGYIYIRLYLKNQDLREKLLLNDIRLVQEGTVDGKDILRPVIHLQNIAPYQIHIRLKEFKITVAGASSGDDPTNKIANVIAPNSSSAFVMPSFAVPSRVNEGRVSVTVDYGAKHGGLTHAMETTQIIASLYQPESGVVDQLAIVRNTLALNYYTRRSD